MTDQSIIITYNLEALLFYAGVTLTSGLVTDFILKHFSKKEEVEQK